jgi:hypothetical protein
MHLAGHRSRVIGFGFELGRLEFPWAIAWRKPQAVINAGRLLCEEEEAEA